MRSEICTLPHPSLQFVNSAHLPECYLRVLPLVLPSCGSPVMSALLPLFLAVPISLMVLFEVELLDKMRALTQPDDDGNIPRIGRAVLYVRNVATKVVDMDVGRVQVVQATGHPTVEARC